MQLAVKGGSQGSCAARIFLPLDRHPYPTICHSAGQVSVRSPGLIDLVTDLDGWKVCGVVYVGPL